MATDFYGDYANIIQDSIYGFIDKKGRIKLFENYDKTYFYYGNTGIAKKGKKYGLIDRNGKPITDFKYIRISNFGFHNFRTIEKGGLYSILNEKGRELFKIDTTYNIRSYFFRTDSLLQFEKVVKGRKLNGLMNLKKEIIIEPRYDKLYYVSDKNFYAVAKDGKWGFIDNKGKEAIPIEYDKIGFHITENLIPVKKGKKWGFINKNNEIKIPFEYDEAYTFLDGLAFVKKGDFFGCINTKNKIKIDFKLNPNSYPFFSENLAVYTTKEGKDGFINKKGKIVIPAIYDSVLPFLNGLAFVRIGDKFGYINKKGKEIVPIKQKQMWYESEGMIRFAE